MVGTGANGAMPVMKEVKAAAKERKIELLILPTYKALEALQRDIDETNAILHVTCSLGKRGRTHPASFAAFLEPGCRVT